RTLVVCCLLVANGWAQTTQPVSISVNNGNRFQTIQGFGTALFSESPVWDTRYLQEYTKDLGASILRIPLNPDILPSQVTLGPDLQSNVNLFNFMGNYPQTNWGVFANQAVGAKLDQMKLIASI